MGAARVLERESSTWDMDSAHTQQSAYSCLEKGSPTRDMNTLTLIRHGKGGMRAPGRCDRDTCPGERKPDAGHEFGLYVIINAYVTINASTILLYIFKWAQRSAQFT